MPSAKTKLEPFKPGWLPVTLECNCQIPPKHGRCNGEGMFGGENPLGKSETGRKESSLHFI